MYGYDVPLVSNVCNYFRMIVVVSGKALSATTVFFGITTDCKDEQFLNALPPIIFVSSLILNDIKLFGMLISFEPSFGYVASFAHLSIILYVFVAYLFGKGMKSTIPLFPPRTSL